jgi:hypothetical protein
MDVTASCAERKCFLAYASSAVAIRNRVCIAVVADVSEQTAQRMGESVRDLADRQSRRGRRVASQRDASDTRAK